jgi:hypothetical protein
MQPKELVGKLTDMKMNAQSLKNSLKKIPVKTFQYLPFQVEVTLADLQKEDSRIMAYTAGKPSRLPKVKANHKRARVSILIEGKKVSMTYAVYLATKALGKPLPRRVIVHHLDGNSLNDAPSSLVICPNAAYHGLLHRQLSKWVSKNGNKSNGVETLK